MGLGKTIQSIALLSEVYAAGVQGPFLVIAPLSTITNWEREFAGWTDMNAIVYHGSLASRQMIQQYEMYCKDDKVRTENTHTHTYTKMPIYICTHILIHTYIHTY